MKQNLLSLPEGTGSGANPSMGTSAWPAILLAAIAGFSDALGYVTLGRIFTAHMSGNAAATAAFAGRAEWSQVLERGLPIPTFLCGAVIGAAVVTITTGLRMRARLAPAFALEAVLLAAFALLWPPALTSVTPGSGFFYCGVSLLSVAMGIQAATLRQVGEERVSTTFVSGMLIGTIEEMVSWAFVRDEPGSVRARRQHAKHALLFASIFAAFMAGAIGGSAAQMRWGPRALVFPICALIAVVIEDVVRSRG